jgi:hypothetical protein
MRQIRGLAVGAAMAASVLMTTSAWAQEGKSAGAARELAELLSTRKLDAIAAKDPSAPDAYVAALHFPGQLLLMSARYSAPALLNERLARREYRDVYIELNAASPLESRFFVTDLGANGLQAKRTKKDDPFDVRHLGGTPLNFDGNWREDKMSEAEYMKAYADAEERYAQAVALLLQAIKQ